MNQSENSRDYAPFGYPMAMIAPNINLPTIFLKIIEIDGQKGLRT